jgi:protein-S-isoprenylcysteine O-methyltransferase Ste14
VTVELFVRWFLAAYFTGVAGFYTITIVRKRRRSGGTSPVHRGAPGSLHARVHLAFVCFRAAIWGVAVGRLAFPPLDDRLIPIAPLWRPPVLLTGAGLLLLAFVAVVLVHATMGHRWRSGIEPAGPHRLITRGAFALTRNPTFIAIQVGQLGLFLALPTVFTLVCLIVGLVAIHLQVRLEEAHLAARFGAAYDAYRRRVPRWLWPLPRRQAQVADRGSAAGAGRKPAS